MTDEPLTICPKCGGDIHKIYFPAGIVFKGSGFYKTDHPSGGPASENGHNHKTDGAEKAKESDAKTATESKSGEGSSETPAKKTSEDSVPAGTK